MDIAITIAVVWIVCGVLAYGVTVHDLNRIWVGMPEDAARELPADRVVAVQAAIMGPLGLFATLLISDWPYGFKW